MILRRSTDNRLGHDQDEAGSPSPRPPSPGRCPCLPLVGLDDDRARPDRAGASASSIMASAIRSLMLPPGLARSSFIQTSTRGSNRRRILTWGVRPTVSRMLFRFSCCSSWRRLQLEPSGTPSARFGARTRDVVTMECGGTLWVTRRCRRRRSSARPPCRRRGSSRSRR